MATTAKGTPYVVSTDLVANYPTVSSDLATHIDAKLAYNAVSINAQTGTTYTFALADASEGKLVTASNAGSQTYTVPPQSSVTWAAGAVLRILNQGAGTVTVAAGAGVTINGTPLTLAQYKGAAIQRTAADTWTFIPFSGGVGNANFSDAATGTYTSGGINYKYITYTASGTLNVTTAGFADLLVIGGGGSGAQGYGGGGGAGGYLSITNAYLPVGSLTVTVGAGGAARTAAVTYTNTVGANGSASAISSYIAPGGGGGGSSLLTTTGQGLAFPGLSGGSGGGGGGYSNASTSVGGSALALTGNSGGAGFGTTGPAGGGGGGAGAAGTAATSGVGGNGGAGTSSSITNTAVTRSGGGGGGGATNGTGGTGGGGAGATTGTATSGTANTGGGGGGMWGADSGYTSGAGGSGVVIIRVAV